MRSARRGLGGTYQRGGVWWIRYSYRGRKMRESSGSVKEAAAIRLLKKRLGEMGSGRLVGPDVERTTFEDLKQMLLDDYETNGRRSVARAKASLAQLEQVFKLNRALDITPDRLVAYVKRRQDDGVKPATIRNELSALKRAFNLGIRAGRVAFRPVFPVISVRNARSGFFEHADFRAVQARLDPDLQPLAEFLYLTGWRKGEALELEWRMIDLKAGIIRIEDSKNGEPRTLPFRALPALAALVERQRERTSAVEQARGIIVRHVFHRGGRRILDFRGAWQTACTEAGVANRIPHDFRRTAARNLSRAGVPERVIMTLCGWKTRSVFDRYRIVNEADLAEGLAKLALLNESTPPEPSKIASIATGTVRAQKGPK